MNINRICLILVIMLLVSYIYAIVDGFITNHTITVIIASVGFLISFILFIKYKLWSLWMADSMRSGKEEQK